MTKHEKPEWSQQVTELLQTMSLSQKRLAELMGVSAATVTRWVNGIHEPKPAVYMAMGNLLGAPEGQYFWERAGLSPTDFVHNKLWAKLSSLQVELSDFQIVDSQKLSTAIMRERHEMVLVPLLNVKAYGDVCPPGPHVTLSRSEIDDLFIAPRSWCPHPEYALCLRLSGDSMTPLIADQSVICVDTAVTDRQLLDRKIAVFSHRDLGFKVARLRRLSSSDVLVSANHKCLPVDVTDPSEWKAVGEVVWWLSKDAAIPRT